MRFVLLHEPKVRWRGPDLNRRLRGYEARPESCQNHSKPLHFFNVLTLLRFCNSVRLFPTIISFLHFLLSQKGNRKTDPICPQYVPEILALAISIRALWPNRFSR